MKDPLHCNQIQPTISILVLRATGNRSATAPDAGNNSVGNVTLALATRHFCRVCLIVTLLQFDEEDEGALISLVFTFGMKVWKSIPLLTYRVCGIATSPGLQYQMRPDEYCNKVC